MVQPKDAGLMVDMVNAIVARVRRQIQFFHLPCQRAVATMPISSRWKS